MKTKTLNKTEQKRVRGLLLMTSGITVPQIADELGVSRQFVYHCLAGKSRTGKSANRVREYIAKKTGLPVSNLWP